MTFTRQPFEGIRLDFPATLEGAREVVLEMVGWFAEQDLTAEECRDWELVLAEATTNAVRHGSGTQPLRIEAISSATAMEIRLTDHSTGFDWPEQAHLPENDESEGGRGLFIIQSLTDHAAYMRGRGENVLCLQRNRRTARPPAEDLNATLDLMTSEVSACYETLANIFRLSSEAARDVSPDVLAAAWLEELRQISCADFIALRMLSVDGSQLETIAAVPATLQAPPDISISEGGLIECRAAISRQDQWFDESTAYDQTDPLSYLGNAVSGIAHPLEAGGEVIGVLTLGVKSAQWEPKARDLNVVRSLGDFLGTLLFSLRRRDESNYSRLIKHELQIAADIQRSLLPTELPQGPTLQCAGHMTTFGEVGGDFVAGFPLPDGGRLFVIADVMGKGVPAALFATAFRSRLHSHLDLAAQPNKLMRQLNASLFAELDRADMFITVQLAYVSADGLQLRSCGAGHGPLLFTDGEQVVEIGADGPPLGVMSDAPFTQNETHLQGTTHILLHTDGLCDYSLPEGSGLGKAELHDWLRSTAVEGIDAWSSRDSLLRMHSLAQDPKHPQDDVTFVILTREAAMLPQPRSNSLTHEHR